MIRKISCIYIEDVRKSHVMCIIHYGSFVGKYVPISIRKVKVWIEIRSKPTCV